MSSVDNNFSVVSPSIGSNKSVGRIIGYFFSGFYSGDTMYLLAAALPIMVIGMYLGGHVHTTISQQNFQRAIGLLLVGSGLALLLR